MSLDFVLLVSWTSEYRVAKWSKDSTMTLNRLQNIKLVTKEHVNPSLTGGGTSALVYRTPRKEWLYLSDREQYLYSTGLGRLRALYAFHTQGQLEFSSVVQQGKLQVVAIKDRQLCVFRDGEYMGTLPDKIKTSLQESLGVTSSRTGYTASPQSLQIEGRYLYVLTSGGNLVRYSVEEVKRVIGLGGGIETALEMFEERTVLARGVNDYSLGGRQSIAIVEEQGIVKILQGRKVKKGGKKGDIGAKIAHRIAFAGKQVLVAGTVETSSEMKLTYSLYMCNNLDVVQNKVERVIKEWKKVGIYHMTVVERPYGMFALIQSTDNKIDMLAISKGQIQLGARLGEEEIPKFKCTGTVIVERGEVELYYHQGVSIHKLSIKGV